MITGSRDELIAFVRQHSIPEPNTGCWLWLRSLVRGYGQCTSTFEGKRENVAHRLAYRLLRGPIPVDCELDHLCRQRSCINPDHLEAVSHRVNSLRGQAPTICLYHQNRCSHGHSFTPDNTLYYRGGIRYCRACIRDRGRERYRAKRRAAGFKVKFYKSRNVQ